MDEFQIGGVQEIGYRVNWLLVSVIRHSSQPAPHFEYFDYYL